MHGSIVYAITDSISILISVGSWLRCLVLVPDPKPTPVQISVELHCTQMTLPSSIHHFTIFVCGSYCQSKTMSLIISYTLTRLIFLHELCYLHLQQHWSSCTSLILLPPNNFRPLPVTHRKVGDKKFHCLLLTGTESIQSVQHVQ